MFRTVLPGVLIMLAANTLLAQAVDDTAAGVAPVMAASADRDGSLPPSERQNPSRGAFLGSLYVSFAALQVYDGYTTTAGVANGATEANGVMSGVAYNGPVVWAVKGGVTVLSIAVAERLWRRHHHPQAIVMMLASNGIMAAVAVRNASVLRAQSAR